MILLNRETRKSTSMVGANGHLNELGRVRLTRELFCGRYRPGQRVRLREIAAKYGLDNHAVLKLRGTETCCGFGKLSCSTYEFESQSAKCPRTFLKSLSRINQSSMHSETVEQGKPACCCAATWRLSPSTSRNQIPT